MSNVIDFLERVGQDAQLRYASLSDMRLALQHLQFAPELQMAILGKDQPQLEALLGRGALCSMLFPVKEDEDEDREEIPSKDDEEITLESRFHVLALAG